MLSQYLDDDLAHRDRVALEEHLHHCLGCRRALQSLSRTVEALPSLQGAKSTSRAETIIGSLDQPNVPRRLRVVGGDAEGRDMRGARGAWQPRWRSALRYCLQRSQLRWTMPIAVLIGALLSLVNQGGMLLAGQIDVGMCAVCALNFALPFLAMNVALLAATRVARRRRW